MPKHQATLRANKSLLFACAALLFFDGYFQSFFQLAIILLHRTSKVSQTWQTSQAWQTWKTTNTFELYKSI